jgi:hypothetical protein
VNALHRIDVAYGIREHQIEITFGANQPPLH